MDFSSLLKKLNSYKPSSSLPDDSQLMQELDETISVLETESPEYRPLNKEGKSGYLLDFTFSSLPVIIVPDLHGRYNFLLRLLKAELPAFKLSVGELLCEQKLIILCVGDGIHSEKRGRLRWQQAYEDWQSNAYAGPSMQEEMKENISTMRIVMELKRDFPRNFHFLKGNHENILNSFDNGNRPFYKYANEGQMTCDFIRQVYGDAILYLISLFESHLPVCSAFKTFCVSHAEPESFFTREEIIEGGSDLIHAFTWTDNDVAAEGSVKKLFSMLTGLSEKKALWFGGHRPVSEKYLLRQNGSYVQFHNPQKMNVVVINKSGKFDPEKNIVSVI
ncbi:metallophosphoesterase [Treponema sp.]|uniref:metallophosphoesterase n=1 Tax=Treponema sp. TaxID=166 RepID=UPI0025F29A00|nr:metallophosphoesterase [Treponema sp.]MCR5218245.1 metallophosphoesterase [Treponema sp.]